MKCNRKKPGETCLFPLGFIDTKYTPQTVVCGGLSFSPAKPFIFLSIAPAAENKKIIGRNAKGGAAPYPAIFKITASLASILFFIAIK